MKKLTRTYSQIFKKETFYLRISESSSIASNCKSVKARMHMEERGREGERKIMEVNSRLYLSSFWKPFMYSGTGHPACCITLATLKKEPININLYLVKLMFTYLNPPYNSRGMKTTHARK